MRWSPLVLVLSCSSSPALSPQSSPATPAPEVAPSPPLAWSVIAPATSAPGDVFADDAGIWRCTAGKCQHLAWSGGATREQPLPCADTASLTASQAGTHVVQVCGDKLKITALATGAVVTRGL